MASIEELKAREVKGRDPLFPRWKVDAAYWGQRWVRDKVHPGWRMRGVGLTLIKWFDGEPASRLRGCVHMVESETIWISAKLDSWEDIVEVAAHEQAHLFEAPECDAELIGRLAAKHWAGKRTVLVHHGRVSSNWMPEELTLVPMNAVVLELDNGADTRVNHGTARFPRWRRAVVP